LVSSGDAHVSYCLSDSEGKVAPFKVKVEDTTGAGDAFLAGLIHQLCRRGIGSLSNPEIAREVVAYACAVGGLTTTKPGAIAAQPTSAEVEAFLKQH
jgi:fructokinase